MAEKIRIILDENQDVLSVEANIDGEWKRLEGKKATGGGGTQKAADGPGGCGTGSANCAAEPGMYLFEFFGVCYYFSC
ncbi:hypothetical protein MNBD_GAMMA26-1136 [hydrothermal vent metagenome]|uniref:Uncharacterized protein n=1 Tax=hydrothermal vent metagenome TaxID=652676 RepID=A0A3B1BCM3_9ZZZZ